MHSRSTIQEGVIMAHREDTPLHLKPMRLPNLSPETRRMAAQAAIEASKKTGRPVPERVRQVARGE